MAERNNPELLFSSRSMSGDQMAEALKKAGYGSVEINEQGMTRAMDAAPDAAAGSGGTNETGKPPDPPPAGTEPPAAPPAAPKGEPPAGAPPQPPTAAAPPAGEQQAEPPEGGEGEQPPAGGDRPLPKNRREKKIALLSQRLEEERQARESIQRELADMRARMSSPGAPPQGMPAAAVTPPAPPAKPEAAAPPEVDIPAVPPAKERPKRADFFNEQDPDEAFQYALDDWRDAERDRKQAEKDRDKAVADAKTKREDTERRRQEAARVVETSEQEHSRGWTAQISQARQKYSDWDAVMQTPGELCSEAMGRVASYSAEYGADILYWLGKHPAEATKMCAETKLPPPEQRTQVQYDRALANATRLLSKIEEEIAKERAESARAAKAKMDEPDDDEEDDEPPVATGKRKPNGTADTPRSQPPAPAPPAAPPPAAAPAPPPAAPPQAASQPPAPPARPVPVIPVGGRGAQPNRSVTQMSAEELRGLPQDEYRRMRGM